MFYPGCTLDQVVCERSPTLRGFAADCLILADLGFPTIHPVHLYRRRSRGQFLCYHYEYYRKDNSHNLLDRYVSLIVSAKSDEETLHRAQCLVHSLSHLPPSIKLKAQLLSSAALLLTYSSPNQGASHYYTYN